MDKFLKNLQKDNDGVYSYDFDVENQNNEIIMRNEVAESVLDPWLAISSNHSLPVMDAEVTRFVSEIPYDGAVLDVGGGWAWHWRNIHRTRPDIKVYVLDMIRDNLLTAKSFISKQTNNIFLIHGNATDLIFDDNCFDGYWSVQTLQHVPNFEKAILEASRVLKHGGRFANYSFNKQPLIKHIYKLLGKQYNHQEGFLDSFYLARASNEQFQLIKEIFNGDCHKRFSEILFEPSLKITGPGQEGSLLGKFDSLLSNNMGLFRNFARQQSFHAVKK